MEIKDYCEHCDDYREYDLTSVSEKITIDDKTIECVQVKSTCKVCKKEIYVPSIEDINLKVLDDKRRQLREILSQ